MRTYLTMHVLHDGKWVYVPGALTEDWASYKSYPNCASWKAKAQDVISSDAILLQCVSEEVKNKFDIAHGNKTDTMVIVDSGHPDEIVEDIMGPISVWGIFLAVFCIGVAVISLAQGWLRRRKIRAEEE